MKRKARADAQGAGNDETRQALLDAARKLFAERGYHDVGVRDFAAAAGVTRGALYYYFTDKESVFLAVLDSIRKKRIEDARNRRRASARPDPWTEFRYDMQIALDDAFDEELQRILWIDGPSVLGWARWRELDMAYGLGVVVRTIEKCQAMELVVPGDPRALANLITATLVEASMMIIHANDPPATRRQAGEALDAILLGLGKDAG